MTYQVLKQHEDSDHKPLVSDWRYSKRRNRSEFRAGAWNMYRPILQDVRPALLNLLDFDLDMLFMAEIKRDKTRVDEFLKKQGFQAVFELPEFGFAWNPDRFMYMRHYVPIMSTHEYWASPNRALVVTLRDLMNEEEIVNLVGHPPAHISRPKDPTFENVYQVHRDYAQKKGRIAERAHKHGRRFLGYEDLNIDPVKDAPLRKKGHQNWAWATTPGPVDYHRAPDGTHGKHAHGRHIDNMFSNDLVLVP